MSKEQTPITAGEFLNEHGVEMAILPAEKIRKLVEWCEKEDERINAKVLEALERERKISESLWILLDDIDTASDVFKPDNLESYKAFYDYAMKKQEERHKYLISDGYNLTTKQK